MICLLEFGVDLKVMMLCVVNEGMLELFGVGCMVIFGVRFERSWILVMWFVLIMFLVMVVMVMGIF